MKIRADKIRIRTVPFDDKGDKMEPEAQPVQRIFETESQVTSQDGTLKGATPTQVIYETTVGELATAMRSPCFSCKHFDAHAWQKILSVWNDPTSSLEQRAQLNQCRAALLQTGNAELQEAHTNPLDKEQDMDVEHALSVLGICRPISEIMREPVIVYPTSSCPGEFCTPTQPNGFYDAKDKDADRLGSATYDNVLKTALGQKL